MCQPLGVEWVGQEYPKRDARKVPELWAFVRVPEPEASDVQQLCAEYVGARAEEWERTVKHQTEREREPLVQRQEWRTLPTEDDGRDGEGEHRVPDGHKRDKLAEDANRRRRADKQEHRERTAKKRQGVSQVRERPTKRVHQSRSSGKDCIIQ